MMYLFQTVRTWTMCLLVVTFCSCKDPNEEKTTGEGTLVSSGGTGTSTTGASSTTAGADCSVNPGFWECDPWCQDCPDGQKCFPSGSPYEEPKASCIQETPVVKQLGEPCNDLGLDDCAKGLICLGVDPKLRASVCTQLCSGTPQEPSCASEGERCFLSSNGVLGVCLPVCDPVVKNCPLVDDQCSLNDPDCVDAACLPLKTRGTFRCHLDLGSTTSYGSPCLKQFTCASGQACVASDQLAACSDPVGCCTPYCDLNDPQFLCPDTDKGMKCLPAFEPGLGPQQSEHVGICRLP